MRELVFNIGSPGVGALATSIWREQAREIKAMGQWRKAWYREAPEDPADRRPGGDPNTMAAPERMSSARIQAMQRMVSTPTRDHRVVWFPEGMIAHHGGALEMAHDALNTSTNPTLRRMLRLQGLRKPEYSRYDALFGSDSISR